MPTFKVFSFGEIINKTPFLLPLYPPLTLLSCFALCSSWLVKPVLLGITIYGKSESRRVWPRACGSPCFSAGPPISHLRCSCVPRLLDEELCSERSVTEGLLTHGMLGLTWHRHLSVTGEPTAPCEGVLGIAVAYTLSSGRNLGFRLGPLSPSPLLFSCDSDVNSEYLRNIVISLDE